MFNEEARRKELGISSNIEALVTERREKNKSRKPSSDYNRGKSRESQSPEKK